MKHLRVLQVGLSLAILAGMPSVVSAQSGETWMLTYFPVPYASYDNIYMKQSQADNGITPRFKVGAKQNTSFELRLGHNLPNNVSDSLSVSGTAVLQNTCADIPQTINGETNPAFTTCTNANSNKGATLKFDTDVYTQTATFGSILAPSSAKLIFSDLRIANGLGSKDLSTKEITSQEVAVNGKVNMNTSAFTNEAAAALPGCDGTVSWNKLKFNTQESWFLTCGDAPTTGSGEECENGYEMVPVTGQIKCIFKVNSDKDYAEALNTAAAFATGEDYGALRAVEYVLSNSICQTSDGTTVWNRDNNNLHVCYSPWGGYSGTACGQASTTCEAHFSSTAPQSDSVCIDIDQQKVGSSWPMPIVQDQNSCSGLPMFQNPNGTCDIYDSISRIWYMKTNGNGVGGDESELTLYKAVCKD